MANVVLRCQRDPANPLTQVRITSIRKALIRGLALVFWTGFLHRTRGNSAETRPYPPVVVKSIQAVRGPEGVCVRWETAMELGAMEYHLQRENQGQWISVSAQPLLAHASPVGSAYEVMDHGPIPAGDLSYRIIELDEHGYTNLLGPITTTLLSASVTRPPPMPHPEVTSSIGPATGIQPLLPPPLPCRI